MKSYPYSYEEFKNEVKKQYLKDYCKNNKTYMESMFKSEGLEEIIKNSFESIKKDYEETGESVFDLAKEVRSTVACLGMF